MMHDTPPTDAQLNPWPCRTSLGSSINQHIQQGHDHKGDQALHSSLTGIRTHLRGWADCRAADPACQPAVEAFLIPGRWNPGRNPGLPNQQENSFSKASFLASIFSAKQFVLGESHYYSWNMCLTLGHLSRCLSRPPSVSLSLCLGFWQWDNKIQQRFDSVWSATCC